MAWNLAGMATLMLEVPQGPTPQGEWLWRDWSDALLIPNSKKIAIHICFQNKTVQNKCEENYYVTLVDVTRRRESQHAALPRLNLIIRLGGFYATL